MPRKATGRPTGVRLNPQQDARSRAAIKTTLLLNRLQAYALNQPDEHGRMVDLNNGQLKAIEILLRKTLPDLANIALENGADGALTVKIIRGLADVEDDGPGEQGPIVEADAGGSPGAWSNHSRLGWEGTPRPLG